MKAEHAKHYKGSRRCLTETILSYINFEMCFMGCYTFHLFQITLYFHRTIKNYKHFISSIKVDCNL